MATSVLADVSAESDELYTRLQSRFQGIIDDIAATSKRLEEAICAEKQNDDLIKGLKEEIEQLNILAEISEPAIMAKALDVLRYGNPVEYIMHVFNKMHVGDTLLAKILLLSIANQSVINSDGLQPKLTGSSGKGKTHAAETMCHLIADLDYKIEGSLSSKALFYKPDMRPGTLIFSDDVQMSEDLDSTLKRAMSNFQKPTKHTTLIKQQYTELEIPPRTVFWMTSVNTNFSDELINRLYDINVDESPDTDRAVTVRRTKRAKRGDEAYPVTEEVLICRAIIHMIKSQTIRVLIPYSEEIDWKNSSDRRNYNRFLDLVNGFAAMRYPQRDEIGENEILASVEDFDDAKALYDATSQTQVTKLTKAERRLAQWLVEKRAKTINEMVNEYLKEDGTKYTYTYIYKCFKGIKGKGGLLDKVPGLLRTYKDGDEAFTLDYLEENAVGSIVTLKPGAYERYS